MIYILVGSRLNSATNFKFIKRCFVIYKKKTIEITLFIVLNAKYFQSLDSQLFSYNQSSIPNKVVLNLIKLSKDSMMQLSLLIGKLESVKMHKG